MKRPSSIAYSVEERPPPALLIATAIQHVGVVVMFLIYPLLVAKQGNLDADEILGMSQFVVRASSSAQQAVLSVIEHCSPNGPIKVTASYDEFDIVIQISYFAPELMFSKEPPSRDDVMASLDSHRQLAGYLVARHADQVVKTRGESAISLRFKH